MTSPRGGAGGSRGADVPSPMQAGDGARPTGGAGTSSDDAGGSTREGGVLRPVGQARRPGLASRLARAIGLDLALFLLALVPRLVAVVEYEHAHPNAAHPVIDEASYDRWARAISGGDWVGREVFFQEPLYPYALAVVYAASGGSRLAARVVQCALWALAAVLVRRLGARAFGRAAGSTGGILLALYGPGMLFPSLLLKENLFLPLLAGFALLLLRSRAGGAAAWWGIGALGGLGALLRGNMLVLLPVFAAWPLARLLVRRVAARRAPATDGASSGSASSSGASRATSPARALADGALVLLGAACVLAPVALRNRAVGGALVLTTSGAGTNLYGGNNRENPYGRATEFSFVRGVPEHEAKDWEHEAERRAGRELDPAEVSAFWRDEVLRSVRADPGLHLSILWNKLRLSLGAYEVPDNHLLAWDARFVPLARLPWPRFGVVGTLGLAGIALAAAACLSRAARARLTAFVPADAGAALELAALFLAYLATVVLTVTSDRARLPLLVALAPFAGHALAGTVRAARSYAGRALIAAAAALLAAGAFVASNALPAHELAEDLDEREYNLAVQRLHAERRPDEARAIAERLAASHPRSARLAMLLAEIDVVRARAVDPALRGREGLAERSRLLADALARTEPLADDARLPPRERFRARHLAAWILLEGGRALDAQRRYREALEFDPEGPDLLVGLARARVAGTDELPPEQRLAALEGALAIVARLEPGARGDRARRAELELLAARAEFLRGALLRAGAGDDEARLREAEASVRSALARLRAVAEDRENAREHQREARTLAGAIQLELGDLQAAENHLRRALDHGPDREARLALADALLRAARALPPEQRAPKLEEARRLLDALAELDPSDARAAQLRSTLESL